MNTFTLYPVCDAVAAGLLHSLWLFPALTLLGWLAARGLRQARHRYVAYLTALGGCAVAFGVIVLTRFRAITASYDQANFLRDEVGASLAAELTTGFAKLGLRETLDWTRYVVVLYVLGVLLMLARYGYRYWGTVRVRRASLLAPPQLRPVFARLSSQLLPGRRVDWRISGRVGSVLVTGILRPVVLFPVGLVNQLTTEEVAAILRHELIHLRRHDPFWNALQELIRAVFFYHPAVHWLCRALNREREFACDDAVLRHTEPKTYARALLRAANYSLNPTMPLTMSATASPHFTQRIQRLFTPERPEFTLSRLTLLPVLPVLLLTVVALFQPYQLSAQSAPAEELVISGVVRGADTGQPLIGTAILYRDGETGTVTDIDGRFVLKVPNQTSTLSFSYVGYESVVLGFTAADPDKGYEANVTLERDGDGQVDMMVLDRQAVVNAARPTKRSTTGLTFDGNILYLIDGIKHDKTLGGIKTDRIKEIRVIKDKGEIAKLGHGTNYSGAILITTKQ